MAAARHKQMVQVAILTAITLAVLNAAFFFLSDWYFGGRKSLNGVTPADINHVRFAFLLFTGSIGAASILASAAPRTVGHGIALVMGLVSLVASIAAFAHGMTPVLPMTLLIIGGLLPMLAMFSMKTSRAAWSFLTALCGVYATVLLFGAPKVRGLLDIGLWTALIVPGLLAVATVSLVMSRADYRDAT
jgi:hypothetical protein